MKTQIIYDNEGYILSIRGAGYPNAREPIGVPFLKVEIPEGKRIKVTDGVGVDVSKTPHEVILEDIPPNEIDVLRKDLNDAVMELSTLISMGGM